MEEALLLEGALLLEEAIAARSLDGAGEARIMPYKLDPDGKHITQKSQMRKTCFRHSFLENGRGCYRDLSSYT